jgi:hypothetical protein
MLAQAGITGGDTMITNAQKGIMAVSLLLNLLLAVLLIITVIKIHSLQSEIDAWSDQYLELDSLTEESPVNK